MLTYNGKELINIFFLIIIYNYGLKNINESKKKIHLIIGKLIFNKK